MVVKENKAFIAGPGEWAADTQPGLPDGFKEKVSKATLGVRVAVYMISLWTILRLTGIQVKFQASSMS